MNSRMVNGLRVRVFAFLFSVLSVCAATPLTAQHVLLLSFDGMHQQDVERCIKDHSCPAIAALARAGVMYQEAYTPGLSDSFPGLAALITGGTPRSTGLFYDVSYDRTLYAPSDLHCTGKTGWNMVLDESVGRDGKDGGVLKHLDGGGGFNPQAIPRARVGQECLPVYPHNYLQTNTVFEVVKAQRPSARTAYTDKHAWAYDWVNGPSGKGVDDMARTEINSIDPRGNAGKDYTQSIDGLQPAYLHTEAFDDLHLKIVLNQIQGKDSAGNSLGLVPVLFGSNFQTLSVAQKTPFAQGGGYRDSHFTPGPDVAAAIRYLDTALAQIQAALRQQNLEQSTVLILTSKHGQSPTDHASLVRRGDTLTALLQTHQFLDAKGAFGQFKPASGNPNDGSGRVATGMVQTDDVGLIWLADPSRTAEAVQVLRANAGCTGNGICADAAQAYILSGAELAKRFGDPAEGRAPDIIVQPNPGVIYSSSKKKDQEHGGNAADDSHVPLLIANPALLGSQVATPVVLTQVAPSILRFLELDPSLLHSVVVEGTAVLPGLDF